VLARIGQCLREAIAGRGSLLVLEGPAGIGKTRLVLAAERHGHELGLTVLSARGSELERDFAYGLVRELFEAPLVAASPPERAKLLAGAAGHAARLFGLESMVIIDLRHTQPLRQRPSPGESATGRKIPGLATGHRCPAR